jgi:hypothetical protein
MKINGESQVLVAIAIVKNNTLSNGSGGMGGNWIVISVLLYQIGARFCQSLDNWRNQ